MKKLLGIICSILICGTIFTSFSPSLDGRAIVADKDVLPQGLFARAFGYLPGDSISVTSLSSKQTVDILVIGAIPAEEGIAILLSPEAAAELEIPKNSNNVVKITKRTGQLDEAVAGTAVIGTASEVTDIYEEKEDDMPAVEPEVVAEEIAEEPSFSVAEKSEVPVEAESVEEEEIVASLSEEDEKEEVSSEEYDENVMPEETNSEGVVVITPTEEKEVEEVAVDEDSVDEEKTFTVIDGEATVAGEPVEADDLAVIDENYEKIAEPFDEELNESGEYDRIEAEKKAVVKTTEESEKVESVAETTEESENAEIVAEVTEESANLEIAATDSVPAETEEESYEPIVLVPAEANPPAKDETEADVIEIAETEEKTEAKIAVTEVAEEIDETTEEKAKVVVAKEVVPESATNKTAVINLDKYKVSSLADLEKGKFYVQIAMLGNEENIRATIKKYGKEYPVTLVPLANEKGYQFLIGSLNMDEYGTVLNRFKSYGYKDAFLRRIK